MLPFLRSDLSDLHAYSSGGHEHLASGCDKLDANEFPEDLPAWLKEKLAFLYTHPLRSNRYPDGSHLDLRQAIAEYVCEAGASISPDQISLGNGSDELIRSILIATCLNQQGSILVADPTFSMYAITARTLGIPVVSLPREPEFQIDLSAAQTALAQNPTVRVVFLVHPNSPTGNPLTEAELAWARSLPPKILVVVDEAYYEFSDQTVVQELAERPNWLVMRTFSKAFRLAAHRLGYVVAHPELALALEKVRLPYNLPSLSQAAAQLALAHRSDLMASIPALKQERDRLYQVLRALPGIQVWPSAGNFLFLRTVGSASVVELHQALEQQGTLVRLTGGGLRLTIGQPAENQRTLERLQQHLLAQAEATTC